MTKVYVVVDHIPYGGDMVEAVFSTKNKALLWILDEQKKPQQPHWWRRFQGVEVLEFDLG